MNIGHKTLRRLVMKKKSQEQYRFSLPWNEKSIILGAGVPRCSYNREGAPASYIPQLARGDPTKWGASLCTTDGQRSRWIFTLLARFSVGDYTDPFSIQSASKPFTYALALNHMGAKVHTGIKGTVHTGSIYEGATFQDLVYSVQL